MAIAAFDRSAPAGLPKSKPSSGTTWEVAAWPSSRRGPESAPTTMCRLRQAFVGGANPPYLVAQDAHALISVPATYVPVRARVVAAIEIARDICCASANHHLRGGGLDAQMPVLHQETLEELHVVGEQGRGVRHAVQVVDVGGIRASSDSAACFTRAQWDLSSRSASTSLQASVQAAQPLSILSGLQILSVVCRRTGRSRRRGTLTPTADVARQLP